MKRYVKIEIDVRTGNENRCGDCRFRCAGGCRAFLTVRDGMPMRLRFDRDCYYLRCPACRKAEVLP